MKPSHRNASLALALAVLGAGCERAVANCDLASSSMIVTVSGAPAADLQTTGAACGAPFCTDRVDAGGCTRYAVALLAAGTCHLVATAVDGRQQTADVTIQLITAGTGTGPCGGSTFSADEAVIFAFPLEDGGTPDGAGDAL